MKIPNPIEAFIALLSRVLISYPWMKKGPGKVVESMPSEYREALSQLTSNDLNKLRVEDYYMMDEVYDNKIKLLELDKKLGIQAPPRKKYDQFGAYATKETLSEQRETILARHPEDFDSDE